MKEGDEGGRWERGRGLQGGRKQKESMEGDRQAHGEKGGLMDIK